jgi:hypothetical protein
MNGYFGLFDPQYYVYGSAYCVTYTAWYNTGYANFQCATGTRWITYAHSANGSGGEGGLCLQ